MSNNGTLFLFLSETLDVFIRHELPSYKKEQTQELFYCKTVCSYATQKNFFTAVNCLFVRAWAEIALIFPAPIDFNFFSRRLPREKPHFPQHVLFYAHRLSVPGPLVRPFRGLSPGVSDSYHFGG